MATFTITITGTVEAETREVAEAILVEELLPWENIDTANFTMTRATVDPA